MSDRIDRNYTVMFSGKPTLRELKQELERAERLFGEYVFIEIERDTDPEDAPISYFHFESIS